MRQALIPFSAGYCPYEPHPSETNERRFVCYIFFPSPRVFQHSFQPRVSLLLSVDNFFLNIRGLRSQPSGHDFLLENTDVPNIIKMDAFNGFQLGVGNYIGVFIVAVAIRFPSRHRQRWEATRGT